MPAAHGEDAVRGQAPQEDLPGVDRVEPVLAERERTGARRRPGVDQIHLDDVELFAAAREPAAGLVHHQRDAADLLHADKGAEQPVGSQQVDERRIDLDARDLRNPEQARGEDVPAAAHPDHRGAFQIRQIIGQIRDVALQEGSAREVALDSVSDRAGIAVDRHATLRDGCIGRHEGGRWTGQLRRTHRQRRPRRDDAGKRIPLLEPGQGIELHRRLGEDRIETHPPRVGTVECRHRDEDHEPRAMPAQYPGRERWLRRSGADTRVREEHGPQRDERRTAENGGRSVELIEQDQHAEAADRGPDEVDAVHAADRKRAARQGEADHDAREEERRRDHQGQFEPDHDRREGKPRGRDERHLQREPDHRRKGKCRAVVREVVREGFPGEARALQVDPYGPGGQAEHGHADDEEGEMVPDDDGQHPGLDQLQHQGCRSDAENTTVEIEGSHAVLQPQWGAAYNAALETCHFRGPHCPSGPEPWGNATTAAPASRLQWPGRDGPAGRAC